MTLPKVGVMINWFGNAQRSVPPQAALVIGHTGGLLTLHTTDSYGVQRVRNQVRHMDDHFLIDNHSWRTNYGAWDYIEPQEVMKPAKVLQQQTRS